MSSYSPALKEAFDAGSGSSTLEIKSLLLAPRLFPYDQCHGPRTPKLLSSATGVVAC
ncbi:MULTISPECIES: hypothetical protein [unclassified Prochlorococcus]|uniref:hypothetical protein n=1 Tax=unclassified Prochlorococcus TaxID=2627481 RepID=UPI000533BE21|nr:MULTISPECIES: hypothetical protein [unclassified Prochlorococcus]KGG36350.1 hypothetical protein EV14_0444 [Prochlorococcus sp. MIT 0703]